MRGFKFVILIHQKCGFFFVWRLWMDRLLLFLYFCECISVCVQACVCVVLNLFKTSSWNICRYFAVIKPMRLAGVDRRGKVMLCIAWIGSCICSMPQAIIFHVETHPNITHYQQCVTYHFFKNEFQEVLYSVMGMMLMYALPLVIIIYCYASIYIELYKKSKKCVTGERNDGISQSNQICLTIKPFNFRSFQLQTLKWWCIGSSKAKNVTYDDNNCNHICSIMDTVLCYVGLVSRFGLTLSIWRFTLFTVFYHPHRYWIDKETAVKVDQRIQKGLFLFACANSCMNPIVYGLFNIPRRSNRNDVVSR